MEELDLSFNKISEIKGLDTLIKLKRLNLVLNKYKKIKGLGNLRNLEVFSEAIQQLNEISKI